MINVYSKKYIKNNNLDIVWDVELKFKSLYNLLLELDGVPEIVKYIDNAIFVGRDKLDGKFGICNFSDISTGAKALILSLYYKDTKIVNFIECGDNVLQCANDLGIDCYIYTNRLFILKNVNTIISSDGNLIENYKLVV